MGKIDYIQAYYAAALAKSYRTGREWAEANVPLDDAIAWANAGYTPAEAAPLIAQGVTPEMAATMEQIEVDADGGPDEHAAQVTDRLVSDGALIDPRRVTMQQDPDDPDHTIVTIRPEPA